jgi:hypothetical protein
MKGRRENERSNQGGAFHKKNRHEGRSPHQRGGQPQSRSGAGAHGLDGRGRPNNKGEEAGKKKIKVKRGVEGWKASVQGYENKLRGKHALARMDRERDWKSAREKLKKEKELGEELGDLIPILGSEDEDNMSKERKEDLKRQGIPIEVDQLRRAYPALMGDGSEDEEEQDSAEKEANKRAMMRARRHEGQELRRARMNGDGDGDVADFGDFGAPASDEVWTAEDEQMKRHMLRAKEVSESIGDEKGWSA